MRLQPTIDQLQFVWAMFEHVSQIGCGRTIEFFCCCCSPFGYSEAKTKLLENVSVVAWGGFSERSHLSTLCLKLEWVPSELEILSVEMALQLARHIQPAELHHRNSFSSGPGLSKRAVRPSFVRYRPHLQFAATPTHKVCGVRTRFVALAQSVELEPAVPFDDEVRILIFLMAIRIY